jgi:8-oxo-dGTP pyrophosphatase MutT (NUDIX family)
MGLPFEQIRKMGKLPGPVESESYKLQYNEATVEMENVGVIAGKRVLLVDDLLATGGTAMAGAKLVERLGGIVAGFTCITELPALGGRGILSQYRVESLISIVDDVPYTDAAYCVDMYVTDRDIDDLLLLRRLTKPVGYAMPGGHLEGESLVSGAVRELLEEANITTAPADWKFTGQVLAAYGRDTRDMKVSFVLQVKAPLGNRKVELDRRGNPKHELHIIRPGIDSLPDMEEFTLGHGPVVYDLWREWITSPTVTAP